MKASASVSMSADSFNHDLLFSVLVTLYLVIAFGYFAYRDFSKSEKSVKSLVYGLIWPLLVAIVLIEAIIEVFREIREEIK